MADKGFFSSGGTSEIALRPRAPVCLLRVSAVEKNTPGKPRGIVETAACARVEMEMACVAKSLKAIRENLGAAVSTLVVGQTRRLEDDVGVCPRKTERQLKPLSEVKLHQKTLTWQGHRAALRGCVDCQPV